MAEIGIISNSWGLPCWLLSVCPLDPFLHFFALPCSLECVWGWERWKGGWECWFLRIGSTSISCLYLLVVFDQWQTSRKPEGGRGKNPRYLSSFSNSLLMVWQSWVPLLLCLCWRLPLSQCRSLQAVYLTLCICNIGLSTCPVRPRAGTGFPLLLVPGCLATPYWFF